ncbi:hypothetical protein ElyMa_004026100 [Elysia marginata]|uniref:Uncharacterized protein n=1 Tax=Elysia marginata TaxID=1093978 RepID=A0AAV4G314_9GAST|nr:hypothetical protein ElyMa_004026100 [Elysia marginata]
MLMIIIYDDEKDSDYLIHDDDDEDDDVDDDDDDDVEYKERPILSNHILSPPPHPLPLITTPTLPPSLSFASAQASLQEISHDTSTAVVSKFSHLSRFIAADTLIDS